MNESMVTFQGWIGGAVRLRSAAGTPVASFRVASTPRRFNRTEQAWSDGPTQWYTVNAWRTLGEHCAASLHQGEPVVVHGRLSQSTWVNGEGVEQTSLEVEASFVGHDLSRGITRFAKPAPLPQPTGQAASTEPSTETSPTAGEAAA